MDERVLAERLISYDTSTLDGAAGRRGLRQGLAGVARDRGHRPRVRRPARRDGRRRRPQGDGADGRCCTATSTSSRRYAGPVRAARRGRPADRPRRLRHEGRAGGDDVRGAGRAAAGQRCACSFVCVPDEESEDVERRSTDELIARGPAAATSRITGEPTDLHIGVQAKGVLRRPRRGQRTSPRTARRRGSATTRSSRPTTRSAASRRCRSAASPPTSSTARRSTSRASRAATPSTRCPTAAGWTSTSASCPTQDPGEILAQIRAIPDIEIVKCFTRAPAIVSRKNPYVLRAARRRRPLDRGRGAEHRPRRRLATPSRSSRPGSRRSSSARSAAATTAPRSGCRSPRCARYRQALGDFVTRAARWLTASADDRPARGRGRAGVTAPEERPRARRASAGSSRRAACSSCC